MDGGKGKGGWGGEGRKEEEGGARREVEGVVTGRGYSTVLYSSLVTFFVCFQRFLF